MPSLPILREGQELAAKATFLRFSDPPRWTGRVRLTFEITDLDGQRMDTPGRCSHLELARPQRLVVIEAGDQLTLHGLVTKALDPRHYEVFGQAQRIEVDNLRLNDAAVSTADSPNRMWVAHPQDNPSKLDRLTTERMESDRRRRDPRATLRPELKPPAASTVERLTLSVFLRNPSAVLARLDDGDIVLQRRDDRAVRLSLEGRSRDRDAGMALIARMLAELARDSAGRSMLSEAVQRSLTWVDLLPPHACEQFVSEFLRTSEACAEIGVHAPLMELLRDWQETAAIYADPELVRRLTQPLAGDGGAVPEPSDAQRLDYAETG